MFVRRERPDDVPAVRAIHVAAFRRDDDEPVEAPLLDELRLCSGWIPTFSLVAVIEATVVGHAVATRGAVGPVAGLGLGPIAVTPSLQRSGAGSALMHTMIGAADAAGEPFIALLGAPEYYSRFGFVPSTTVGIAPPEEAWGGHFQVRTLSVFDRATRGTFEYAEPFDRL